MEGRPQQPTVPVGPSCWSFWRGLAYHCKAKLAIGDSWPSEVLSSRDYAMGIKFLSFQSKDFQLMSPTL